MNRERGFVILLVVALLFFSLTAGYPLASGDSPNYTTLAAAGKLWVLPSHFGYIVMGWLAIKLVPFLPAAIAMQGLSVLCGALGVASIYQVLVYHTDDQKAGVLAALALMTAGEYWLHATTVEVYIVQAGLLITGYMLWLYAGRHPSNMLSPKWLTLLAG